MALILSNRRYQSLLDLAAEQLHIRNKEPFEALLLHHLGRAWRDEWARASRQASESHQNAVDPDTINVSIAQQAASAFLLQHGPTIWPDLVSEREHLTQLSSVEWKQSSKWFTRSGPVFSAHGKITRGRKEGMEEDRLALGSQIGRIVLSCIEKLLEDGERGRQRSEQKVERLERAIVTKQIIREDLADEMQDNASTPPPVEPVKAIQASEQSRTEGSSIAAAISSAMDPLYIRSKEPFEALVHNCLSKAAAKQPSEDDLELLNAYDGTEIAAPDYVAAEATYHFLVAHGEALWPTTLSQRSHLKTWSRTIWKLPNFLLDSAGDYPSGPIWELHGTMTNRERSIWKGVSRQWPTDKEMIVQSKIGKTVKMYIETMYKKLDGKLDSNGEVEKLLTAVLDSGGKRQSNKPFLANESAALRRRAKKSTLATNQRSKPSQHKPIDLTTSDNNRHKCPVPECSFRYSDPKGLDIHLLKRHDLGGAIAIYLEGGAVHIQSHGYGGIWPCPVAGCPYHYSPDFDRRALQRHIRLNHPEVGESCYFRCTLAGCPMPNNFMQAKRLEQHQEELHGLATVATNDPQPAAVGLDIVDPLYNLLRPLIEHPAHAHPLSHEGGSTQPQSQGGGAKWPCPVPSCPYNYRSSFDEQAFRHHVHTNHSELAKKSYFRCTLAGCPTPNIFMQGQELERHQERFHKGRADLTNDVLGGEGVGGPVGQHKRVIEIVEGENGRTMKRRRDSGYGQRQLARPLVARQTVEQAMKETGGLGGLPLVGINC